MSGPALFIIVFNVLFLSSFCSADIRLKQKIIPKLYQIKLYPDLYNGSFRGQVLIDIQVNDYYPSLTLHSKDLDIGQTTLRRKTLSGYEIVNIKNVVIKVDDELITLNLKDGEQIYLGTYNIEINYKGKLRDDMTGFYRSYYDYDGKRRWLGATQFEANYARRAFPCFDEPHFRAGYTVDVFVPNSCQVISNVKATKQSNQLNTEFNYHFENYPNMPTYLLAWVIFEKYTFDSTESYVSNGIEFKTWTQKNTLNQASYANAIQSKLLYALQSFIGVNYTLAKMDQVTIPDFDAGAMENWGLVTYRERYLYTEGISTTEDLRDCTLVIAHEFTHQWFGDLVTLDWWSYTWLNEAFARYFQYYIVDGVYPEWQVDELFVVSALQPALDYDKSPHHAMTNKDIKSNNEISDMFDVVTYSKGASIVRMMEHLLTPTNFRSGLSKYIKSLAETSQVATPNDLFKLLSSVAPNDLPYDFETIMRSWTDQSGFPFVKVIRNYKNNTMKISQKHFSPGSNSTSNTTTQWYIPLTYSSKSDSNFNNVAIKDWLDALTSVKTINTTFAEDEWVIFNIQHKGFYRVLYDEDNWNLIIKQLIDDHKKIGTLNRAQLVDDAFTFAKAGLLNYTTVLNLTLYLSREKDYAPWVPAINGLTYLLDQFYGNTDLYNELKAYLLELTEPILSKVGFQQNDGDKLTDNLKRIKILNFVSRIGNTLANNISTNIVADLKNGTLNPRYNPDVQKALLCTGVQDNSSAWTKVYSLYQKTQYATQKILYLSALSCSRDDQLLTIITYDSISENPTVRRQDINTLFKSISSTPEGAKFMLTFVIDNYKDITKYNFYKTKVIGSIISWLSDRIYETSDLLNLIKFNENNQFFLGKDTYKSILKTIEKIRNNFIWRTKYAPVIEDWVKDAQIPTESPINDPTTPTTGNPLDTTTQKGTASINALNTVILIPIVIFTMFYSRLF